MWSPQVPDSGLTNGFIVKQRWFEVFTSGFAWACFARWFLQGFYIWICFACFARCFSTLIPVNEPLMAFNAACLRTLFPLCVLKHALGRKCSLMATPSKRDSGNAQSSLKFHLVDSQTIYPSDMRTWNFLKPLLFDYKISCISEEQIRKSSLSALFFSRFALSLDKIGCISEEQIRKSSLSALFFSRFALSLHSYIWLFRIQWRCEAC